jgi:hypothetical protein
MPATQTTSRHRRHRHPVTKHKKKMKMKREQRRERERNKKGESWEGGKFPLHFFLFFFFSWCSLSFFLFVFFFGADDEEEEAEEEPIDVLHVRFAKKVQDVCGEGKLRIMDIFKRFDKNNDGALTRKEFINGIKNYKDAKFDFSDAELERLARHFDSDKNNRIDTQEFLKKVFNFNRGPREKIKVGEREREKERERERERERKRER